MSSVEFTSEAVRGARFREKLKGYHPEDVDAFLERTAAAVEQLTAGLAQAEARAVKAEEALAANTEAEDSVRKTLVLAQRTADLAVAEAEEEANQVRGAAEAEAARVREEAGAEAARVREEAGAEAARVREEAGAAHAGALGQVTAMLDEATRQIASDGVRAQLEREELAAEAVRASKHEVGALLARQEQLQAEVGALSRYLAGERSRVLEVLAAAMDGLAETLVPARPGHLSGIDELIDGSQEPSIGDSVDRVQLAEGTPDPATEDSWSFDPKVLEQPENQWWSSPDGETAGDPPSADQQAADATAAGSGPGPGEEEAGSRSGEEASGSGPDEADRPDQPDQKDHTEQVEETLIAPDDDAPPARLLFTLEDDGRHADADHVTPPEAATAGRARKPILGRRRG